MKELEEIMKAIGSMRINEANVSSDKELKKLYDRGGRRDVSILKDPRVNDVYDTAQGAIGGPTPLTALCGPGLKDYSALLKHPEIDKVINVKNGYTTTALHSLASNGDLTFDVAKKIMEWPRVYTIKDSNGDTPIHDLARTLGGYYDDEYHSMTEKDAKKLIDMLGKSKEARTVKNKHGETAVDQYNALEAKENRI